MLKLNCPDPGGHINDMLTNTFNTYSLHQYVEVLSWRETS